MYIRYLSKIFLHNLEKIIKHIHIEGRHYQAININRSCIIVAIIMKGWCLVGPKGSGAEALPLDTGHNVAQPGRTESPSSLQRPHRQHHWQREGVESVV